MTLAVSYKNMDKISIGYDTTIGLCIKQIKYNLSLDKG
ncbi:hypothetical protein ESCOCK404B1_24205 [Escherichia coli]